MPCCEPKKELNHICHGEVAEQDKKKKPRGRASKQMQYNHRFITTVVGFRKKKGPNSSKK
ncbi:40s ribosomal protein [Musa troglodytarum]|uniref:40S ribosomal protein S30 n=1 Tax=Musa troglodytarum TaxID=320322 RepID=A0A9E7GAJ1_9LILI|nr:40s ribosomal protein [Musa troglodytarum]